MKFEKLNHIFIFYLQMEKIILLRSDEKFNGYRSDENNWFQLTIEILGVFRSDEK